MDAIQKVIEAARRREGDGDAVIATDLNGTILYWSAGASSLYGWSADEVTGRNIIDVTPTRQTVDEAMRIMEQLRSGQTWEGDFIVRHRDGTPIYAHVADVPVRDGETLVGIVGVSRRRRPSRP